MKTDQRFQLIFEGKFLDGVPAEVGRQNLLRLFKGNTEAVTRLFRQPSVVVKRDLDPRTALKWANAFKAAGAACRLEPQPTGAPAPVAGQPPRAAPRPAGLPQMTCPKCGLAQPKGRDCRGCGIVVAKYRAAAENAPQAEVVTYTQADEQAHRLLVWKNTATITLAAGLVLLLASFFMKDRFPDRDGIDPRLYRWPYQTQTRATDFKVRAGGQSYHVTPLYNYELYGLVASYYDSTGWWDVTHRFLWKDFINIKDICVVYGENVRNGVYREMSFKSGSWTCWPRPKTARAQSLFYGPCLSNNHLLSDRKAVNRQIMKAERGDQIHLKGYLVGYTNARGGFRGTSIDRIDEGNGACETIWVTDFRILKKANRVWRVLFSVSSGVVTLALLGLIAVYWIDSRRQTSRPDDDEAPEHDRRRWSGGLTATLRHNGKVIFQLALLLALLLLWARLH